MFGEETEDDAYAAETAHGHRTLGFRLLQEAEKKLSEAAVRKVNPLPGLRIHYLAQRRPWCDVEFGQAVIEEFCKLNGLVLSDDTAGASTG